jgi:PadR family transcriptional regulator PadR
MEATKKGAQMRKGVLELCILSILSHNEMYTSDLLAALKEAQLLVVEGTIYPLLSRLKNEGLLKYRWEESPTGPPRKYFSLTEEGISTQGTLKTKWQQLSISVNSIIK